MFYAYILIIRQLDAKLKISSYKLILSSSNNYLRICDKYLETVNITGAIINLEQILDAKLFLLKVIDSEKLKSVIICFENVVVSAHDSLYRI